jgi:hypothetical protein
MVSEDGTRSRGSFVVRRAGLGGTVAGGWVAGGVDTPGAGAGVAGGEHVEAAGAALARSAPAGVPGTPNAPPETGPPTNSLPVAQVAGSALRL